MRTIGKFPFDGRASVFTLLMPENAEVLAIQVQPDQHGNECTCLWALVESTAKLEERAFAAVATGAPCEHRTGYYIGTYQLDGGRDVAHIFEIT